MPVRVAAAAVVAVAVGTWISAKTADSTEELPDEGGIVGLDLISISCPPFHSTARNDFRFVTTGGLVWDLLPPERELPGLRNPGRNASPILGDRK